MCYVSLTQQSTVEIWFIEEVLENEMSQDLLRDDSGVIKLLSKKVRYLRKLTICGLIDQALKKVKK